MVKANNNPMSKNKKNTNSKSEASAQQKRQKRMTEYGKQLYEKQKVKQMYGMRERQFRRFFDLAVRQEGAPGDNLLSMLESRLDNVVFRLKLASSRPQARQMVVHGHIQVNGKKVTTPSCFVSVGDVVRVVPTSIDKKQFVESVVNKRLSIAIKVPEWLELKKSDFSGQILRRPVRTDIQVPIEEHLIVELYSK